MDDIIFPEIDDEYLQYLNLEDDDEIELSGADSPGMIDEQVVTTITEISTANPILTFKELRRPRWLEGTRRGRPLGSTLLNRRHHRYSRLRWKDNIHNVAPFIFLYPFTTIPLRSGISFFTTIMLMLDFEDLCNLRLVGGTVNKMLKNNVDQLDSQVGWRMMKVHPNIKSAAGTLSIKLYSDIKKRTELISFLKLLHIVDIRILTNKLSTRQISQLIPIATKSIITGRTIVIRYESLSKETPVLLLSDDILTLYLPEPYTASSNNYAYSACLSRARKGNFPIMINHIRQDGTIIRNIKISTTSGNQRQPVGGQLVGGYRNSSLDCFRDYSFNTILRAHSIDAKKYYETAKQQFMPRVDIYPWMKKVKLVKPPVSDDDDMIPSRRKYPKRVKRA